MNQGPARPSLERELTRLSVELDYPRVGGVAASVVETLRRSPSTGVEAPRRARALSDRVEGFGRVTQRGPWRRVAVAAAIVILLVGAVASVPDARRAVARWLGLAGVRIEVGGPSPGGTVGGKLDLGRRVTSNRAQQAVDFTLRRPLLDDLGPPDAIFVDDVSFTPQVSFIYEASTSSSGPSKPGRVLLSQFSASLTSELINKSVGDRTSLDIVSIGGAPAYWISGAPHTILVLDASGDVVADRARLAGNTLLWTDDGITLRLESTRSKRAVLRIARSVR